MKTSNEIKNEILCNSGISVNGPLSEIRRLTKLLDDYFANSDSPMPVNTIIKESRQNYSIRAVLDSIYKSADRGETAIIFLALIIETKYRKYLTFSSSEESLVNWYKELNYMVNGIIRHEIGASFHYIRSLNDYMKEYFESSYSPLPITTIVKDGNEPYSIRRVLDEINFFIESGDETIESLYSEVYKESFNETDLSEINSTLKRFLRNISN